jgi:hypothetical protein
MWRIIPSLCLCLGLTGCQARFSFETFGDAAPAEDLGPAPQPDLTAMDLTGLDLSGLDLTAPMEQVLSRGTFEDRAGHLGRGGASLVRRGAGLELAFDAQFQVSGVPGPFVYLTSRADMGTQINAATDVEIARLKAFSGAQSYPLPAQDFSSRPYVFIFCKPFSVEVARAVLRPAS